MKVVSTRLASLLATKRHILLLLTFVAVASLIYVALLLNGGSGVMKHLNLSNNPPPSTLELTSTRDIAEAFISSHNVSVFSKSGCPYCARAKLLLTSYETSFTAMELDLRHDGADIQDYLEEKTGQRTVPNIFLQQIHVGGCDALNRLDADGKLRDMLAGLQ